MTLSLLGKVMSNKTFYGKLAEDWDVVYRECMELFPEPADTLDGTTFRRMPTLYRDLQLTVDLHWTDYEAVKVHTQEIVDRFNDRSGPIGVWKTFKINQSKLYTHLQEIGVKFYKFEDQADTQRINLIDTLKNYSTQLRLK